MQALSRHLRPAPYPYGLLTLRLLGKLGGKNRQFLREPVAVCADDGISDVPQAQLALQCKWLPGKASSVEPGNQAESGSFLGTFSLPLPLASCVETLKLLAATEVENKAESKTNAVERETKTGGKTLLWKDSERLLEENVEDVDFASYCSDVMDTTRQSRSQAAFCVVRAALAMVITDVDTTKCSFKIAKSSRGDMKDEEMKDADETQAGLCLLSQQIDARNQEFVRISLGIMYGCLVEKTKDEAVGILKGFTSYMFFLISSHNSCFQRIDANGSHVSDDLVWSGIGIPKTNAIALEVSYTHTQEAVELTEKEDGKESPDDENDEVNTDYERLGSLKPFGYFHRVGILRESIDPLLFNKALARFLAEASPRSTEIGIQMLRHMLSKASEGASDENSSVNDKMDVDSRSICLGRGGLILFENLLANLCEGCFSEQWNQRDGLQEAICLLIEGLGSTWAQKYESEIMNVAFSALKSVARELSTAVVKAFSFFVRVCVGLYGRPDSITCLDSLVWDALAMAREEDTEKDAEGNDHPQKEEESVVENPKKKGEEIGAKEKDAVEKPSSQSSYFKCQLPCSAVVQVLFTEMAASKQIVRQVLVWFLLWFRLIERFSRAFSFP